jgi:hypothetical protein
MRPFQIDIRVAGNILPEGQNGRRGTPLQIKTELTGEKGSWGGRWQVPDISSLFQWSPLTGASLVDSLGNLANPSYPVYP